MAGGAARRAGARFSRILKMTAWGMDFCYGLGLLVQVINIYISPPFKKHCNARSTVHLVKMQKGVQGRKFNFKVQFNVCHVAL